MSDDPFPRFKATIEEQARGSFNVEFQGEKIGFSNGADLLYWLQGEMQGPRIVREPSSYTQLPEPGEPERRGIMRTLRGGR